jgi:serine/threonine protein kinase
MLSTTRFPSGSLPFAKELLTRGLTCNPLVAAVSEARKFLKKPSCAGDLGEFAGLRIFDVIGAGGMGMVFLAFDTQLQRLLALKTMLPEFANVLKAHMKFFREAQAQAAINHKHVVPIYCIGEENGIPFLTMPYLRGPTLEAAMPCQGTLLVSEILRIGREIAEGLAAAHAVGLVHRDIKPNTILLEGEERCVKILDLGLAKPTAKTRNVPLLTTIGTILGTPSYMSPEQARGKRVDHRSDLFSLGSVLYRMATGQHPFRGLDAVAMAISVATDTPCDPESKNPELPRELSRLILNLLAKDRRDRPATAELVVKELSRIQEAWQSPG